MCSKRMERYFFSLSPRISHDLSLGTTHLLLKQKQILIKSEELSVAGQPLSSQKQLLLAGGPPSFNRICRDAGDTTEKLGCMPGRGTQTHDRGGLDEPHQKDSGPEGVQ